jgi:hypothetical protein
VLTGWRSSEAPCLNFGISEQTHKLPRLDNRLFLFCHTKKSHSRTLQLQLVLVRIQLVPVLTPIPDLGLVLGKSLNATGLSFPIHQMATRIR